MIIFILSCYYLTGVFLNLYWFKKDFSEVTMSDLTLSVIIFWFIWPFLLIGRPGFWSKKVF